MPNICEICGKGILCGNNVSHSHLKTKKQWKPNIQQAKTIINGKITRINTCTRCLRSGKINKV